jgi:hypothetical protein
MLKVPGMAAGVFIFLLLFHGGSRAQYRPVPVINGGSIKGVVKWTGDAPRQMKMDITKDKPVCGTSVLSPRFVSGKNKGVKNAVVYIEGITSGKPFPKQEKVILNQTRCEYQPHVVILPLGSPLEISNGDPVLHNVHGYMMHQTAFNIAQPMKGQETTIAQSSFAKPGFVDVTCDAGHPWMSGVVAVVPHPYYCITDGEGRYTLDNVPPGTYRCVMWHEGAGVTGTVKERGTISQYTYETPIMVEKQVVVTAGGTAVQDFEAVFR